MSSLSEKVLTSENTLDKLLNAIFYLQNSPRQTTDYEGAILTKKRTPSNHQNLSYEIRCNHPLHAYVSTLSTC